MTSQSTDELKECREAFEDEFGPRPKAGVHAARAWDERLIGFQAAWNHRPTCEQQLTTNEGQDTLTDSAILTDAHRYCCKYVHADEAPYRFTERGIIEFVNLRIARHLSAAKQEKA